MEKRSTQTALYIMTGTPKWEKTLERAQEKYKQIQERKRIAEVLCATINSSCLSMKELSIAVVQASKSMEALGVCYKQVRRGTVLKYVNNNWVRGKKLQKQFLTKGRALKSFIHKVW